MSRTLSLTNGDSTIPVKNKIHYGHNNSNRGQLDHENDNP